MHSATDDLLTIADIVRRIPGARGARRLHPSTITRWILRGAKAIDGRVVRLPATRVGSRWLVRAADLDEFFRALGQVAEQPAGSPPCSAGGRSTASRRAAEELQRIGA